MAGELPVAGERRQSAPGAADDQVQALVAAGLAWSAARWAPTVIAAIPLRSPVSVVSVLVVWAVVVGAARVGGVRRPWPQRRSGRSRMVLLVVIALVVGWRSVVEEAAFTPAPARTVRGEAAHLVGDPTAGGPVGSVLLQLADDRRVVASLGPEHLGALRGATAGVPVRVSGRVGPLDPSPWARRHHLVGRLRLESLEVVGPVGPFRRPSEWFRSTVRSAATGLDPERRALYLGLVIGDDRDQPPSQRARFRVAGLGHLLAVSGQNVAFLLSVAGPLLRRLPRGWRAAATVWLLVVFAVATRLEPSVLRATVTAGIGVAAALSSARSTGVQALSAAVVLLLVLDPFLATSVGFQLSVAASLGILVVSPMLAARLGAGPVAEAAALTLGAQLGVAPLLLATFGPVSLVTIPANLAAGWAAGLVMALGSSVGVVAGVAPAPVGALLVAPADVLVRWIDLVASVAAAVPAPVVRPRAVPVLILATAAWWTVGGAARRWRVAVGVATSVVAVAVMWPGGVGAPPSGVRWFPGDREVGSVLVLDGASAVDVAEWLVDGRLREVAVVVSVDGGRSGAAVVAEVRRVASVDLVLAPGDHRIVGARRVIQPVVVRTATGELVVAPGPSLEVESRPDRSG